MTSGIFHRTELLLGSEMMQVISAKRVIIFGVGGVGSWCAESLVRSGIGNLTIVDFDSVTVTNINRQLMATSRTVGEVKVDVLKARLLEINPSAHIEARQETYTDDTAEAFHLEQYDYVIDCIDSLKDKVSLLLTATKYPATVFSSMGAALKMDPTQIKVAEFWKVRGCPLGAALRKRMKRSGQKPAKKVLCVYSEELLPQDRSTPEAQANGSMVHVTAIFGFTLAGLVMQHITGNNITKQG